ncbi:hypothetical protein ILYODFUR_024868 [Ilyodon furcidens]|uniref:Uncharacterized protein n=1 Tax=Ilyodon furcidens TaxID=33524 RepID=A0ABV0V5V6_9TELE
MDMQPDPLHSEWAQCVSVFCSVLVLLLAHKSEDGFFSPPQINSETRGPHVFIRMASERKVGCPPSWQQKYIKTKYVNKTKTEEQDLSHFIHLVVKKHQICLNLEVNRDLI